MFSGMKANIMMHSLYLCGNFRYMSGSRLLDSGGRVKVRTSMLSTGVTALSVLSIDRVDQSDRGNYTCKPASGGEASISLHVLEGNLLRNVVGIFFRGIIGFLCPHV